MKFKTFLSESKAESEFNRLIGKAGTIGAHSGGSRVVYRHKGGTLKRTLVTDHDTGYTSNKGTHYAQHYSAKPGHDVYTHVHFKGPVPKDKKELEDVIRKQNPKHEGTGHIGNLASDILKHHVYKD